MLGFEIVSSTQTVTTTKSRETAVHFNWVKHRKSNLRKFYQKMVSKLYPFTLLIYLSPRKNKISIFGSELHGWKHEFCHITNSWKEI